MLCALFAGVFRYIDTHFHDSEAFVENTASLADNAEIRERIFEEFRAEIVSIDEGVDLDAIELEAETEADGADTDGEADAAGDESDEPDQSEAENTAITEELIARDEGIEEVLLDVLDSELYQQVFDDGLVSVQDQLIRSAGLADNELLRDPGEIIFDGRRLYAPSPDPSLGLGIYERLAADPRTAAITQNEVPPTYGVFPIADRETTLDTMWWSIENGPNWRSLTFVGAILSLIGAVVIAERRPSRIIQFGAGIVGLALVAIVAIYVIRAVVPLLASGGDFGGAVSAVYAANIAPLVGILVRLLVIGAVLAGIGAVARLIWPDDWVYGQVADDRGVRSVRRRKGTPEAESRPVVRQAAAAAPVVYQPYPQQPPYGYAPPAGWGQPYPPPGYPPGYGYPVGPYAQPAPQQPVAPYSTGQPTVPVLPVHVEGPVTGENPAAGNGAVSDAAGVVPRVVASATPHANEAPPAPAVKASRETVVQSDADESPIVDLVDPDDHAEIETMAVPIVEFTDPDDAPKAKGGDSADAGDEWASDEEW